MATLTIKKYCKPLKLVSTVCESDVMRAISLGALQLVVLFTFGAWIMSCSTMIGTILDLDNGLVCRGNSVFLRRGHSCVAVGAVVMWGIYYTVSIGMLQAFHVWATVTRLIKAKATGQRLWCTDCM
jgi:hypothetical protein